MGSVQSALNTYGMGESGFYIKPTVESLKRIGGLFIHTERTNDINYKGKIYKQYQAINMTLAKKVQITWGHGRLKNQPLELDGFTYFDFSDDFYQTFIKTAVPHIQSQYLEIKAPIEQDLYVWLAQKLFTLKDETEKIPWTWLFTQFAPKAILKGDALQHAKTNIKNALLRIQRDFYKTAKFEFTYEGVILKKSPPLIEPGDKKAGYAPGRAWDQEQVGDIPEWKPPKLSIPMMEFTDEELEIPGKNLPLP